MLAGRMTSTEFEERVERVYAATTRDQLDDVTSDLPTARPRTPAALERQTTRRPRVPGQRSFAVRFEVPRDPEDVIDEATRVVGQRMIRFGYRMEPSQGNRLVFTLPRSLWPLAALLIFPFGVIGLLFVRWDESQVVMSAREIRPGRSVVDVFGVAPRSVRRAMLELADTR
jgi:hypothetical protein